MSVECSHAPASSNCSAAVAAAACTGFEEADAVAPCASDAEPSDEDANGSSDHDDVEQDVDAVRDVLRSVVDQVASGADGDRGDEGPIKNTDANVLPTTSDSATKASPPPAAEETANVCAYKESLAPPLLSPIPMDDLESTFGGSLPTTPTPFGMSSEQAILAQLRKFHGTQELEDDENGNVEKVTEQTTALALAEDKENANTTGGSLPSIVRGDRSSSSSLECLDEKRRIPAMKLAPVPGRKPIKPGRRKTKMPPPPPLVWAAAPQPLTPPRSPPAASFLPRRIEQLKGSIPQLRNLRCSPRSTLTVHVKMDTQDVYQTFSLPSSSNCVLNDEFKHELPANFNALHFVVAETTDGCSTRPLGRVTIRRKDLVEQSVMDQWLPIMPFSKTQTTEVVGDLCLDVDADPAQRTVAIRVLDYTVWKGATSASGNRFASTKGELFLKLCISGWGTHSAMKKLRIAERRGLDTVRVDCRNFEAYRSDSVATTSSTPRSAAPPGRNASMDSVTMAANFGFASVPGSVASTPTVNRTMPFPPVTLASTLAAPNSSASGGRLLPTAAPLASTPASGPSTSSTTPSLHIKVYTDTSYDESSYCGHVRVPLDEATMLPIGAPLGPAWHSIKSRTTLTSATSSSSLLQHNQLAQQQRQQTHRFRQHSLSTALSTSTHSAPPAKAGTKASTTTFSTVNKGSTTTISTTTTSTTTTEKVGEMRLRLFYSLDEVLPLVHYQPLYTNLVSSVTQKPYSTTLTSVLQNLPIDMESVARSLMKVFVQAGYIRPFFREICSQYVASCHDVNTLFRSQSMASKVMYELMKFLGHQYLVLTVKPLVDLIYAERKNCEIDPSRLKQGDSLDQNLRNLTVYAELAFSRVVDSRHRCPQALKDVLAELRDVVSEFYPERENVARLALSSFLIMRFFAAAILNPKLFGLKREAPDADVLRTLVLVSKILQRLANCSVSNQPLSTKEAWLTPVLDRFSDEAHKSAMVRFLDDVSCASEDTENTPLIEQPGYIRTGHMVERRTGGDKKRSFKNLIHQKRRYVTLSETELCWQKVKEQSGEVETKGQFALADITSVSPLTDAKNAFRVATTSSEVHFQAGSPMEMNEWVILIQKQQRRHMMLQNRPAPNDLCDRTADVDMERELEVIHGILVQHYDTLLHWRAYLEDMSNYELPEGIPEVPLERLIPHADSPGERDAFLLRLYETLTATIAGVQQIQSAHTSAKQLAYQVKLLQQNAKAHAGAVDGAALAHQLATQVDNENYLHMRSGVKRIKKASPSAINTTAQFPSPRVTSASSILASPTQRSPPVPSPFV